MTRGKCDFARYGRLVRAITLAPWIKFHFKVDFVFLKTMQSLLAPQELQSKTDNDRRGFLKRGFLKEEDVIVKYTLFGSCMALLFKATLILLTLIALVPVPLPCQPFSHPLRQ